MKSTISQESRVGSVFSLTTTPSSPATDYWRLVMKVLTFSQRPGSNAWDTHNTPALHKHTQAEYRDVTNVIVLLKLLNILHQIRERFQFTSFIILPSNSRYIEMATCIHFHYSRQKVNRKFQTKNRPTILFCNERVLSSISLLQFLLKNDSTD